MSFTEPSLEEIREWAETAAKRNAILPLYLSFKSGHVGIVCGRCETQYTRKLLAGRNDPVFVCPQCQSRNYVPIEW